MPNTPITYALNSYINGFQITYVDQNALRVSPGAASDITNANEMNSNVELLLKNNVVGPNGLDHPYTSFNKIFYIYIVGDSTGYKKTASIISEKFFTTFNTSENPILPGGYDMFRRIGSVYIDSLRRFIETQWIGTGQSRWIYSGIGPNVLSGGNSTVFEGVPMPTFMPNIATSVSLSCVFSPAAISNKLFLFNGDVAEQSFSNNKWGGFSAASNQSFSAQVTTSISGFGPFFGYLVEGGAVTISLAGYLDDLSVYGLSEP